MRPPDIARKLNHHLVDEIGKRLRKAALTPLFRRAFPWCPFSREDHEPGLDHFGIRLGMHIMIFAKDLERLS